MGHLFFVVYNWLQVGLFGTQLLCFQLATCLHVTAMKLRGLMVLKRVHSNPKALPSGKKDDSIFRSNDTRYYTERHGEHGEQRLDVNRSGDVSKGNFFPLQSPPSESLLYLHKVDITNSMEQSPSWEATDHSASQEIPCLYGTPWFITMFTRAHHWSLSRTRWIQSTSSYPVSV